MKILAIETSCDDTCISILESKPPGSSPESGQKNLGLEIKSNIISSQVKIHQKWGGIYPSLAKREHQKILVPVLSRALKEAKLLKKTQNSRLRPSGFGGQVKFKTLREILEREDVLYEQLKKFFQKYQKPEIDLIAVTIGPGLEPCLWVGVNFAKALAYSWELPIIPVNHIEAHIIANFVGENSKFESNSTVSLPRSVQRNSKFMFPAICLVVSGGHTQLILMKDFGQYASRDILTPFKYKILGETRDDAAGECLDKVARILGLGYPGGPAIAKIAASFKSQASRQRRGSPRAAGFRIKLPRPMIHQKNYDFSFSGLKTAVLYKVKADRQKIKDKKYIQEMCYEVQQAVVDVLISKTLRAAKDYRVKTIILGGGVTANDELRKQFNQQLTTHNLQLNFLVPPKNFCTDNAAMVGATAYYYWLKGCKIKSWRNIGADANLRLN